MSSQLTIFPATTRPGSISGEALPQDPRDFTNLVYDPRYIKEGVYPTWRFTDWENRYGAWGKDYVIQFLGMGTYQNPVGRSVDIVYGMLADGRIDEFGAFSLFPIIENS